jgi:hypothetical protein
LDNLLTAKDNKCDDDDQYQQLLKNQESWFSKLIDCDARQQVVFSSSSK